MKCVNCLNRVDSANNCGDNVKTAEIECDLTTIFLQFKLSGKLSLQEFFSTLVTMGTRNAGNHGNPQAS